MSFAELWASFVGLFADGLKGLADGLSFLGPHKWAAAVVVLTLIVRTLLLPLAIKQIRSMQAMQRLGPEVKRLQQKYRKDRQKLNTEMMELYKREGANPLGGCLPMIAQSPVLFGMFYAIRNLTDVSRNASLVGLDPDRVRSALGAIRAGKEVTYRALASRCGDLGALAGKADGVIARACDVIPPMPFLGLGDLGDQASSSIAGWMLLGLMTATSLLSTRQLNPGQDPSQRRIQQFMPIFFVFIMINFPAGLVLYWATQNIYQFVQQYLMLRGNEPPPIEKRSPKRGPDRPATRGPGKQQSRPNRNTKSKRRKR